MRAASAASTTAITMFRTRYVMAACSLSPFLVGWSVDELDGARAEVRPAAASGGGLDSRPDHLREVARDRPLVPVRLDGVDVEADPADDVVARVRALAGQRVGAREKHLG